MEMIETAEFVLSSSAYQHFMTLTCSLKAISCEEGQIYCCLHADVSALTDGSHCFKQHQLT